MKTKIAVTVILDVDHPEVFKERRLKVIANRVVEAGTLWGNHPLDGQYEFRECGRAISVIENWEDPTT